MSVGDSLCGVSSNCPASVASVLINTGMSTVGINLFTLIIAVIVDLGGRGGGANYRRTRWAE